MLRGKMCGICFSNHLNVLSPTQTLSPDVYRGKYRANHPDPATAYADEVKDMIDRVHEKGGKVQFVCDMIVLSDVTQSKSEPMEILTSCFNSRNLVLLFMCLSD